MLIGQFDADMIDRDEVHQFDRATSIFQTSDCDFETIVFGFKTIVSSVKTAWSCFWVGFRDLGHGFHGRR